MTIVYLLTVSHLINLKINRTNIKLQERKFMRNFATQVYLLAFLIFIYGTNAATIKLTIDDAIKTALANSYDTRTSKLSVEKAEAQVDEALGTALPTLSLSANYTRNLLLPVFFFPNVFQNKPNEIMAIKVGADNSFQTSLNLQQILFNSAVFTAIGTSKIYADASKHLSAGVYSKTIAGVKKAFYGVLLAKEIQGALELSFKNANENLKTVQAMFNEGMIAEYDKIRAEVAVENIRPMMLQAQAAVSNATNGLKMAMGTSMNDSLEVVGELSQPVDNADFDEIKSIMTLLESNPDLQSLEEMKKVNMDLVSIKKSEYYPTIALFGNYMYQGQSNTFDFMTAKSSLVGLNFSLSLFQGLQTNARVQQAKIDYMTIETKAKQLEEALKMQLKNTLFQIQISKSKLAAQTQTVNQAQRGYDIAGIRYKEGIGSQMEINDADNALIQAKVNKFQAIYEFITALADYDYLMGKVESKYLNEKLK